MDFKAHTHCPDCFKPSQSDVCAECGFNRETYLAQHAASHHLPLFTLLANGFTIGRVLGEGSFAIVYAAFRERNRLHCAVKEYYPHNLAKRGLDGVTVSPKQNPNQLALWENRFIQEAELLRSCYDYPPMESGVVRYSSLIKQHNTVYLAMERLYGESLEVLLIRQKPLTAESICLWLKPLLEALQKLHSKDIYHRDISPNNIFLCAPGQPVLMDFGLARQGVRDNDIGSTTLGAGTFIAPEQFSGGHCDARTDLYSLGAIIYLCLHGDPPPPLEARRQKAPLQELQQASAIEQVLQSIAVQCLELDLNQRPKNAAVILAQLNTVLPKRYDTIIPDEPETKRRDRDLALWRKAKTDNNIAAYRHYLAKSELMLYQEAAEAKIALIDLDAQFKTHRQHAGCVNPDLQTGLERPMKRRQTPLTHWRSIQKWPALFLIAAALMVLMHIAIDYSGKPQEKVAVAGIAEKSAPPKTSAEEELRQAQSLLENDDKSQWSSAATQLLALADSGNQDAMRLLGISYFLGLGVEKNPETGCLWYKRSAEAGNPAAKVAFKKLNCRL